MRFLSTLILVCLSFWAQAQANGSFESSVVNLNIKGERISKSPEQPVRITVNLDQMTCTIESDLPEIRTLMNNQMTRKIEKTMGDNDRQFSLRLETNTFVHFYLDERKLIMITRDDVHPMQWGMMFKSVQLLN